MPKTLSPLAQYLFKREEARVRAEGEARGEARAEARMMQKYIRNRRKHRIPEIQILKDLQSVFDLDEAKARQYMEAGLAKA